MEKVDEYLSQGVKLVWIVITSTREVLVCSTPSKHIRPRHPNRARTVARF